MSTASDPAPAAGTAGVNQEAEPPVERSNRRFLLAFFLTLALSSGTLIPNYRFLSNSHELLPVAEIARRQQTTGGRFQSAIRDDQVFYKLSLYREAKPAIAVVGSSRMMEFRRDTFTRPMVNLAGAGQSMREIEELVDAALAIHRPEVIVLGLDFWWLSPERADPKIRYPAVEPPSRFTAAALFVPFTWLAEHKVSFVDYLRVVRDEQADYGVQAVVRHTGYEADGRYQYTSWVENIEPSGDYRFSSTLRWIARGNARDGFSDTRFAWADHIDHTRVATFQRIVDKVRSAGVRLVTIMPPLPTHVSSAMDATGRYGFLDEIPAAIQATGVEYVPFDRNGEVEVDDCEYLDGFHPGQVSSLRMLDILAKKHGLAPRVDGAKVEAWIHEYAGMASIPTEADPSSYFEMDFLGLGCPKQRHATPAGPP